MTDLLRSLQELFRLHPLPWRDNGFGYTDHRGYAVGPGQCARLLADHGYDIVSLAEQCEEFGAPADVKADAAKEIEEAEKSADTREEELQYDLDDSEQEVRRLERENEGLQDTIKDLQAALDVLVAEGVVERLS